MNEIPKESARQLSKGQFWKNGQGLFHIVDLGSKLVYYRLTSSRNAVSLTRMIRRNVLEKQLEATAATLMN